MAGIRTLLRYAARYKIRLGLSLLCLLGANSLKGIGPVALQQAIDRLTAGVTRTALLRYSFLLIALALVQATFLFAQEQLLLGVSCRVERDLRSVLFEHLQKLPMRFLRIRSTGDLMALATNDLPAAITGTGEALLFSLDSICGLIVILPIMLRLSFWLTFLAFSPLALVLIVTFLLQPKMRDRFEKVQEHFGAVADQVQSTLLTMKTIRAFNQQHATIEEFRRVSREYVGHNLRRARLSGILYPLLQFFIGLSAITILWYGGGLTASGRLSIGQFLQFILYIGYLAWPMHTLGTQIAIFQQGIVSMARVQSLLSVGTEIHCDPPETGFHDTISSIEFREVTFTYEGMDRPVLDKISFRIGPGQTVGLVGWVGCGKSTLMDMILRLVEPDSGEILINGLQIRKIPLDKLRSKLRYVPQESFLFSDTIAGNIAFGQPSASQLEIDWAATIAGIADEITALPMGYETWIGERGATLSGGQKQRISIARAILCRPDILLLDDALSSIDSHTEEVVLRNLRSLIGQRTCLISSHRISAVRQADRILVLHEGHVVESGTHNELLARSGLYSQICAKQLLEQDLAAS
jgi:ATP-binding cassette, subfamily B, multidrug efflux pump